MSSSCLFSSNVTLGYAIVMVYEYNKDPIALLWKNELGPHFEQDGQLIPII
jgi:hypothetical protein